MEYIKKNIQILDISNENTGQRVDNFLFNYLKNIPKSMIYRLLRNGEIRVNKKRTKPKYKLKEIDKIRIPPMYQIASTLRKPISVNFCKVKEIKNSIIYEDGYIIIINKPSGIAVHGGSGLCFGIIEGLRVLYNNLFFLSLVHRLDIDTSGILIIAKKNSALRELHKQFREKKIKKCYLALLRGKLKNKTKLITAPLIKGVDFYGKRIVNVDIKGKPSETYFELKEQFSIASLVKVTPITGRTHQIRVHAKYIGNPIACDERYGDVLFNKKIKNYGINRLFLHAAKISFIHPKNKNILHIQAPLDKMLKNCIFILRKHSNIFN